MEYRIWKWNVNPISEHHYNVGGSHEHHEIYNSNQVEDLK